MIEYLEIAFFPIAAMQFLWPEVLWAQLVIPLLVVAYIWGLRKRKLSAVGFPSLNLIRPALNRQSLWRRHLPPLLLGFAVSAGLFSLARPVAKVTLPTDHMTLVLALDVSRSMLAEDVSPNRMQAAQEAVRGFVKDLPPNVRVGVVTFAGSTQLVQSPTFERQNLLDAISAFELQRGTATGSGLLMALATLRPDAGIDLEKMIFGRNFGTPWEPGPDDDKPLETAEESKRRLPVPVGSYKAGAIILLTDGRRTSGPHPLDAARLAADFGVKVHTVAFGTPDGFIPGYEGYSFFVKVDEETLKAVSKITDGKFYRAQNADELRLVYSELSSQVSFESQSTEVSVLAAGTTLLLSLFSMFFSLLWFRR